MGVFLLFYLVQRASVSAYNFLCVNFFAMFYMDLKFNQNLRFSTPMEYLKNGWPLLALFAKRAQNGSKKILL
jgi:hypothetical protein